MLLSETVGSWSPVFGTSRSRTLEMRSGEFLGYDGLWQGFLLEVEKNHRIFPKEICPLHPGLREKEKKPQSLNYFH